MALNLAKDPKRKNELLFVGFNQDYGCFACGTEKGFCIYNTDPLKERFRRDFDKGGVGIVEMLFRCNILALVGGGPQPKFPPNKVMIWDDYQNKCIAELEFRSEVKAVKLRRDRIVVVLENKVYVYNFADLQLLHQIETFSNPKGLSALSPGTAIVLAVQGQKPGLVHVELYDSKETRMIQAHDGALAQIVLNLDGTRLATASEKGTLIRIFDTKSGSQLQELRRGADKAEIYSLSFHQTSKWICVSSDKGTVHIYHIAGDDPSHAPEATEEKNKGKEEGKNRPSTLAFVGGVLPYFGSKWSFAQFPLPEPQCLVSFGTEPNTIIAVGSNGAYHKYLFDEVKGGDCKLEKTGKFL
eukprot:TRINITY_DN2449_c0_g2_i1.p1 TRINITY_DN2449_c0_g2~~TRINITY_DN2449_c0_g2_i1.p1  ORF type:complete len:355 (+),score=66.06 TRINITY_DN2449_c0_g2_i1:178-1242(+)